MSEGSSIRVLPVHVANKIAAGEVVDRPASVLKELVENSLDAGATRVDVTVVAGGRKLIAVSDDGRGMERDDALLCTERHATSKIRDVDDIEKIATLGFRGEALAAVASVSRFTLITGARGAVGGIEITVNAGRMQDVRETGCPNGTGIEVRDLFFNVPARRKFLRSHQTELGHVRTCFITQALAHPEIAFSLKVDGRDVYRLAPNASLRDRVREIFGTEYARELREVSHEGPEVRVRGMVGSPGVHRADRAEQYCFVNGRVTSAPMLNFAIREGYHTLVPADRQPCVFLYLEMDPSLVDVNVHPTKREVRFRHPSAVRDAVTAAIRNALLLSTDPYVDLHRTPPGLAPRDIAPELPHEETQLHIADLAKLPAFRYPRMPAETADAATAPPHGALSPPVGPPGGQPAEPAATDREAPWSWCRVLGLVGGLYVVMETSDGLVLLDPRAAHERVLFEGLIRQVLDGKVEVQNLLLPETVELGPQDAARLRKNLVVLKEMGFGVSEFGGNAFVVDALPACVQSAPAGRLLVEITHTLEQAGTRSGRGRWREEAIAEAACRQAVQARDRLTLEEIEKLVVALAATEMPYTSPRGRPTMILTSLAELHRKFGRT